VGKSRSKSIGIISVHGSFDRLDSLLDDGTNSIVFLTITTLLITFERVVTKECLIKFRSCSENKYDCYTVTYLDLHYLTKS
jgi:hypothetical protein